MKFTATKIKKLLVPVDGSKASLEAIALACAISRLNKGEVYLVHVVEVARTLPLDAELAPNAQQGEDIITEAEKVAGSFGCKTKGVLLQAREAGRAVIDEAIERESEAIVIGVEHRPVSNEDVAFTWEGGEQPRSLPAGFYLGEVTHYILSHAPCEVILARLALNNQI